MTLPEDDRKPQGNTAELTVQDDENVWPPWPWPPWDEDDHDHDDDHDKPGNWTRKARKLAREVVKFERRLAKASLDL